MDWTKLTPAEARCLHTALQIYRTELMGAIRYAPAKQREEDAKEIDRCDELMAKLKPLAERLI